MTITVKPSLKRLEEKSCEVFSPSPVVFAYLYGSYARDEALPQSDIDIAVFVRGNFSQKEYAELELNLSIALDKLDLGAETEVRVINRLPLLMKGEILTEGQLIYCCDDSTRVEFETITRDEYFDFLPLHHQYQKTYFNR